MSLTREIVTIQAGNCANFVGAHWWNIQESSFCYVPNSTRPLDINHDVMFRERLNLQRELTYTPRLVLVDLKSSVQNLSKECILYKNPLNNTEEKLWTGPLEIIKGNLSINMPSIENINKDNSDKLPDTAKDKTITSSSATSIASDTSFGNWPQYLQTNLHPNSFCLLDELSPDGESNPLATYTLGDESYAKNGKDMIEDALRKFTEECDYLQGFQLIFDAHNGFSGIASCILQHLDEEYHRKSSLCFPLYQNNIIPIEEVKDQNSRLYAALLSLNNLTNYSSLFSPFSLTDNILSLNGPYRKFPYIHYQEASLCHTSALYALSLETLTSPFRLKSQKFLLADITNSMSLYGRKLVLSSSCIPFPLNENAYLNVMIENNIKDYYMCSISPFYKPLEERTLLQSAVLRGIPKTKFHGPIKSIYHVLGHEELFGQFLNKYSSSSVTTATVFEEPCSLESPFPNFFGNSVGINGYLSSSLRPDHKEVKKIPVAASFHNSDSAAEFLGSLLSPANKISFREYVKTAESAIERDEFQEVLQTLIGLQENYMKY